MKSTQKHYRQQQTDNRMSSQHFGLVHPMSCLKNRVPKRTLYTHLFRHTIWCMMYRLPTVHAVTDTRTDRRQSGQENGFEKLRCLGV